MGRDGSYNGAYTVSTESFGSLGTSISRSRRHKPLSDLLEAVPFNPEASTLGLLRWERRRMEGGFITTGPGGAPGRTIDRGWASSPDVPFSVHTSRCFESRVEKEGQKSEAEERSCNGFLLFLRARVVTKYKECAVPAPTPLALRGAVARGLVIHEGTGVSN